MKKYIRWEELKLDNNKESENLDNDNENDLDEKPSIIQNMIDSHVVTPFGVYRSDSQLNPMNDRIVLIANTNFNLTTKLILDICNVDGVESVRAISRYTVIIMIGTLFDENIVVQKINSICGIDEDSISLDSLTDIEANLIMKASEKSKYWLGYVFPNGTDYIENFDSLEELEKSILYFKELDNFSEGRIFCSEKLEKYIEDDIE